MSTMAIRTHTNPRIADLQPEMRDLLTRNGMQAHIVPAGEDYQLVVQGHDSPLIRYPISKQQFLALTDWGTNHANKKAYNTFTEIVKNDFDLPRNFVHARNANGRVAMGLHGYRIGIGEYGRIGRYGMSPPFLGWTPRQQEGYHLRRVGGQLFYAGTPMVTERPNGRMKAGELQSGGYGFYYKGHPQQQQTRPIQQDVLQELQDIITPIVGKPRSEEPAKPYKELITSPVYFSNEKWQECLSSHGILIDKEEKTLTVQSEKINIDMVYDLTDTELSVLTSNSIEDHPIERRLEILNDVIRNDYSDKITLESLNSKERTSIAPYPEVEAIVVQPVETGGKYKMTAIINGESITHEVSQKQHDKFLAVDDYHREKLFSKIFNEVDMKTRPETSSGLGTKIFTAFAAGAGVQPGITHGLHHPCPEFYEEHTGHAPRPYFKPGVDSPMDVAARNFEARMNREVAEMRRGF